MWNCVGACREGPGWQSNVWGGYLLGPGADGWNLSVPVRKCKPDQIFSFPYKSEGGHWEGVLSMWAQLGSRAGPAPDGALGQVSSNIGSFCNRQMRGFDLSSFQLELNILNVSVAVKRIVLWISELLEAVWIIAVKSTLSSGVINSYIMYPTSLGSQDGTWKEAQPCAIPALPEDHCAFKGDAFCPRTVMVRAGLLLMCQFCHETFGDIFLHLSSSLPFLWCPSHQALVSPRTLLMLGLLELFFASVFAEIFDCCVIMDATWKNLPSSWD